LACLQLRISLSNSKEALKCTLEVTLSNACIGWALCIQSLCTSSCYRFKNALFMGSIALDRFDEVRNQVSSTLQLNGNIAPRFVDANIECEQGVVGCPKVQTNDDNESDNYQNGNE